MFDNHSFNFGICKKANVVRLSDDEVVGTISVEVEQQTYSNAQFAGSGILSEGHNLSVWTLDDVSYIQPMLFKLEIDGEQHLITSKQKTFLQDEKRYGFRKTREQTYMTLE